MSTNGASANNENSNTMSAENPSTPISTDITTACLEAVKKFENNSISKWEVILQIFQALEGDTVFSTADQRAGVGESYLQMLQNHEQQISQAQTRGQNLQHSSRSMEPEPEPESGGDEHCKWS